jgi:hypothetical protein
MPQAIPQLDAELIHILDAIIRELDGIAHNYMSCEEMHVIIDNMIAKGGVPKAPSVHLTRWMHIFSKKSDFKIAQIREAIMSKSMVAVVPDCFGLFHDATAPECKMCADNKACKKSCTTNGNANKTDTTEERVALSYPAGKGGLDRAVIQESLESKLGQIAKILARGSKVVLVSDHQQNLRVLTPASPTQQEPDMATKKVDTKGKKSIVEDDDDEEETPVVTKKGAKATKPVVEDDDEDIDLDEEEEEAPKKPVKKAKPVVEDDDDEEEEAPKAKKSKKAVVEDDDDDEEEEEAPKKGKFKPVEKKAKKEKKPAAELNKAQTEFKEALKTTYKEDKALLKFAKELGVTWNKKEDARINRMLCVMAITKHLGAVGGKKK